MLGIIKFCVFGLKQQKARTALISLSIAIGVFSVLIISIISDNGVNLINGELDSLGICGVSISKSATENEDLFSNEDLKNIKGQNYVESATPVITQTGYLKNADNSAALICGIDENAKSVISVETVSGEKIKYSDIALKNAVCQIDEQTAKELFDNRNPIGKTIDVFLCGEVTTFKVVGIVKPGSSVLQTSVGDLLPNIIYVPFTTLQKITGNSKISQIAVNFSEEFSNDICIEKIKSVVGNKKIYSSSLKVEDLNKQRDTLNNLLNIITVVLKLIGGISLIVSGIGIMTIMLVTVNEKTKEIGIKKSIGAKKSNIVFEFIFESAMISAIGGFVGVILTVIATFVAKMFFNMSVAVDFKTVLITFSVSVLCGVVFGVYPALKASNLKPIDALRSE
ncbi:MAG: FtsX-like permease family protein [Ruminococcaceae bacterium]|nr:FtsX-like permease family protein [Oscillospiraceae bacterium]